MTTTPEQQRVARSEEADDEQGAPPSAVAPVGVTEEPDPEPALDPIPGPDPEPAEPAAPAPADQRTPVDPTRPVDQPEQMIPRPTASTEQPAAPAAGGGSTMVRGAARGPRDVPRWARWTVLPLLVLVPAGYLAVSAAQSRESGESIQQQAATREMSKQPPTSLQKRIYQVPIPVGSRQAGFLETNSWDTSVFDVQFTTSPGGLDTFLAKIGTSRAALRAGWDAITPAQAKAPGWSFPDTRTWAGIRLEQAGDKPDHDIMVDLTDDDAPTVYVVSTVNFQHGFGGG